MGTLSPVRANDDAADISKTVRPPLHRLISSAESILQRRSLLQDETLTHTLFDLLSHCEKILSSISAASTESGEIASANLWPKLEAAGSELLQTIDRLAPDSLSPDAKPEFERVCSDIKEFVRNVHRLRTFYAAEGSTPEGIQSKSSPYRGLVLVVDDDEDNRNVLSRRLIRDGREVMLAEGGRHAMHMLQRFSFDLILLDIMMPDMDGYEVLGAIRSDPALCHIPVIMVTAVDDIESVVRCIEKGADDYLLKPFNRVLLRARTNALLERKRLRDEEVQKAAELQRALQEIEKQRLRSQALLENILPESVAAELQETGAVQPMYFEDVTIVFVDIVGFTLSTEEIPADELVHILHEYFTAFDRITAKYAVEKLKTIGDCYMFAGGLPTRSSSNPIDCVLASLEMINAVGAIAESCHVNWKLRIGLNTGPVIAGVVGIHKFAFDVWGDTVNFGARIEAAGLPNRVNLSASTYTRVRDFFDCQKQEKVRVKEGREVDTYLVSGISSRLLAKNPALTVREAFGKRYHGYFRKPLNEFPAFEVTSSE